MLSVPEKVPFGKLAQFVTLHVLAGLLLLLLVSLTGRLEPNLFGALCVGTIFYQISILGIWAGLGSSSWGIRLVGVLCGVGYLGLLLGLMTGGELDSYYLVIIPIGIIAVILLVARLTGYRLNLSSESPAIPMQYSIRDLLVLTFVVAVLLSLEKIFRATLGPNSDLSIMLAFALGVSVLGCTSVLIISGWQRWMLLRIILLIVIGAGVGMCLGIYLDRPYWLWTTVMIVDAVLLGTSLGTLRSWGYQLSRQRSGLTPS